jgi:small subunit ribosomal protein S16
LIKLRLQRRGRKKRPYYHIVVADSRSPRDGRVIERLGRFDNVSENKELTYDEERVIHWLKIGARPSDTVRNILKKEGILYKMHLIRWGKSDEEIEAALEEWRQAREDKDGEKEVSRKAQQQELLKAEEKEFKKQVEEKAAAAAKELERKKAEEAKAKEEAEAEKAAEEKAKTEETAEETKAEQEAEAKTETETETETEKDVKPEEPAEEKATAEEEKKEEPAEAKAEPEEAEEKEKQEAETAEVEEAKDEEAPAEEVKEEESKAEAEEKKEAEKTKPATVSTDMNANEAIEHIKNTPLEDLKGFVTDEEERVTVQRAWESKQEE